MSAGDLVDARGLDVVRDRIERRTAKQRREAAWDARAIVRQPLCAWCAIGSHADCARTIPEAGLSCVCGCEYRDPS